MYSIPVISHDLSRPEAVRQIVNVLDQLENITDDVFNRISHKIEDNTDRLNSLDVRIQDVGLRLAQKYHPRRHETEEVFSYPIKAYKCDTTLWDDFSMKPAEPILEFDVGKVSEGVEYKDVREKEQFLRVASSRPEFSSEKCDKQVKSPITVESASSLLMFDTDKIAYPCRTRQSIQKINDRGTKGGKAIIAFKRKEQNDEAERLRNSRKNILKSDSSSSTKDVVSNVQEQLRKMSTENSGDMFNASTGDTKIVLNRSAKKSMSDNPSVNMDESLMHDLTGRLKLLEKSVINKP